MKTSYNILINSTSLSERISAKNSPIVNLGIKLRQTNSNFEKQLKLINRINEQKDLIINEANINHENFKETYSKFENLKKNGTKELIRAIHSFLFEKKEEKAESEVYFRCAKKIALLSKKVKQSELNLKELGGLFLIKVQKKSKEVSFMILKRYTSYFSGDEENNNNTRLSLVKATNAHQSIKILFSSNNEQQSKGTICRIITGLY